MKILSHKELIDTLGFGAVSKVARHAISSGWTISLRDVPCHVQDGQLNGPKLAAKNQFRRLNTLYLTTEILVTHTKKCNFSSSSILIFVIIRILMQFWQFFIFLKETIYS